MISIEQKLLDLKKWGLGTFITAALPFLAAFFSWAEDDFAKDYFKYFPYIDSLLLLFTVAVNCFILTLELKGVYKNKILVFIARSLSFTLAAVGALFYMHLMGKEKTAFDYRILLFIIFSTLVNFTIGSIYIFCNYKSNNILSEKNSDSAVSKKELTDNAVTDCKNEEKKDA